MALHYGLVEDPLRAAPAVEALRVWAQAQHQREPFDVILAYFVYPAGYLATVLGEILGVPVVCSCRGNDISKDMFITPEIIAAVLTRSTRLIFVSASLLHMADTLVPCRVKATVVANAVDSTLFTPDASALSAAPRAVVVGTSGLMRWKKGIDLFLPLIRTLCACTMCTFSLLAMAWMRPSTSTLPTSWSAITWVNTWRSRSAPTSTDGARPAAYGPLRQYLLPGRHAQWRARGHGLCPPGCSN